MDIYQRLRKEQFQELIKQCVFSKEVDNNLIEEGELLVHKLHKTCLLLQTKTFNELSSYNKMKEEASLRLMITDQSIDRLISISCKQVQQFCGNVFRIQLIHEYTQFTLHDVIKGRVKNASNFQHKDIIQIIDQILQSLLTLKSVNVRHGYIQPRHVLYDKAQNIYKLSDMRFLSGTYEYRQQLLGFQQECYLSPELFRELGKRTLNPLYNYEKSEIYSLGLTILHCCLLSCPDVYDYDSFKIKDIQPLLRRVELDHDPQISQLLGGMLEPNEEKRFSLSESIKYLNKITSQHQRQTHSHKQLQNLSPTPKRRDVSPIPNRLHKEVDEKKSTQFIFDKIQSSKKSDISPISHQSMEKFSKHNSSFQPLQLMDADASVVHWERDKFQESFSMTALDNYINMDMSNHRQNRMVDPKDKQTKPCPSPMRKISSKKINLNNQSNQSDTFTQRSIDMSLTSYDFMENIKIDAPSSLLHEFSRMDFKVPAPNYEFNTPNRQNYTPNKQNHTPNRQDHTPNSKDHTPDHHFYKYTQPNYKKIYMN